ncbi:MAG TPA: hypothetical protein VND91_09560 [Candidatus Saccharimonadia bacterium]|nr:hypothetical protein [Candidatus Saccharimonadia bacterium]
MNGPRILLSVAVLVGAVGSPRPAGAQTIHRCESASGGLVFTDQQCHLLGAAYRIDGGGDPVRRTRPGMQRVAGMGPRSFRYGIGCAARTPESMLGAVRSAIESGDVNQLSGLYDWNGANRAHAMGVVRRMQRMVSRDLLTVEFDYGDYEPTYELHDMGLVVPDPARPALPDVVVAHYGWGESARAADERFSLTRDSGCIWLAG